MDLLHKSVSDVISVNMDDILTHPLILKEIVQHFWIDFIKCEDVVSIKTGSRVPCSNIHVVTHLFNLFTNKNVEMITLRKKANKYISQNIEIFL